MSRLILTDREAQLLSALRLMRFWVVQQVEPTLPRFDGRYDVLRHDMREASRAIETATGGAEK